MAETHEKHDRKLKTKMRELAYGLVSGVEVISEVGRFQMIIAKSKAVRRYNISRIRIECTIQDKDPRIFFVRGDGLAQQLSLLLDNWFEFGDASFGEHWVEWSPPYGMEVTSDSRRCRRIGTKST